MRPPVDKPASAAYHADLESCRSSATAARGANTAEGFLTGALVGAAHGAAAGAHRGGADVGAIVGASVGAVVGFFHGLHWSRGTSVAACMQSRGYRRDLGLRRRRAQRQLERDGGGAGNNDQMRSPPG